MNTDGGQRIGQEGRQLKTRLRVETARPSRYQHQRAMTGQLRKALGVTRLWAMRLLRQTAQLSFHCVLGAMRTLSSGETVPAIAGECGVTSTPSGLENTNGRGA